MMFHIVIMYIEMMNLKQIVDQPTPYYFSNPELYSYFCKRGNQTLTTSIRTVDTLYRSSFPSEYIALEWFCLMFVTLLIDHYDLGEGPHGAQYIILIFVGRKCVKDAIASYQNHEFHLIDILGGVIIGTFSAAMTVSKFI